ncbi:MAG: hypothetical protein ABI637_09160 [Gemmatimonadota bacterium]
MRINLIALLVASATVAMPAGAQAPHWRIGAEYGESRISGTTRGITVDALASFTPYRPTSGALRMERGGDRMRVGFAVLYAEALVALTALEALVLATGAPLTLLEFSPTVSMRVSRLGTAATLRAEAGPVLDRWTWSAGEPRTRVGAMAGAAIETHLGERIAGVVRVGVAVTGSVFNQEDLPEGFASRASWRRSVALGLQLLR